MSGSTNSELLLTLLVINALLAVVTATVLKSAALPRHVRDYLQETQRWVGCWVGFLVVAVMLLLPVTVFLGFIHTWLIPLPMAAEAVSLLATHAGNGDRMYSELDVVRSRHEAWAMREGFTAGAANQVERLLWATWPLLTIAAAFLFVFGLRQLKQFRLSLVNDLEAYAISGQFGRLYAERLRESESRHRGHRGRHAHRHRRRSRDTTGD